MRAKGDADGEGILEVSLGVLWAGLVPSLVSVAGRRGVYETR